MNSDKMRQAFEAWFEKEFPGLSLFNPLWLAWQAALASQAQEAPSEPVVSQQLTTDVENEDLADVVSNALLRAWQLGQTYWQQADSESYRQNSKAHDTQSKFDKLSNDTRAVIAASKEGK